MNICEVLGTVTDVGGGWCYGPVLFTAVNVKMGQPLSLCAYNSFAKGKHAKLRRAMPVEATEAQKRLHGN